MALLEAVEVTKSFGGVRAVDGVSLAIEPGSISAIIGPNGAGKSTLFNLFGGVYAPDSGRILLDGKDVTGLPPHRANRLGIARTFQKIRLFKRLTVLHNVVIGLQSQRDVAPWEPILRRRTFAAEAERTTTAARELLDFVGLADRADDPASSLSYGRQRVLEIARALATGPRLLLVDEPAAGLNDDEARELVGMLRAIRDRGVTLVIVEHNMDLVMSIAERISVMASGRKLFEGTPREVQRDPQVVKAYLGEEHVGREAS